MEITEYKKGKSHNIQVRYYNWEEVKLVIDSAFKLKMKSEKKDKEAIALFNDFWNQASVLDREKATQGTDVDYEVWMNTLKLEGTMVQDLRRIRGEFVIAKRHIIQLKEEIAIWQRDCDTRLIQLRQAVDSALDDRVPDRDKRVIAAVVALRRFQKWSETQSKVLQEHLNQAKEKKYRAECYIERTWEEPAHPKVKFCSQCGIRGVERGRDCPNRHNHVLSVPRITRLH